jgi:uncharacterized membrane protein YdjX (TVP38/TMEM64 family)
MTTPKPPRNIRSTLWRIFAIVFVIAISVYIFALRDEVEILTTYGYPGVFLFTLLTSATILLPAPGLIVVFSLGGVLNPLWVGLVSGVGSALGELSGYLAGYSGRAVVENTKSYDRIRDWMAGHMNLSSWLIFVLAFIPLPFMDMAGMAAGALKMSVWRFLWWCFLGKLLKMILVAYLGTLSIGWVNQLFLQAP